ncbi:hypothetical protein B0J12DRAFT_706107, partial [Macrophomina phaseolina]
MSDPSLYTYPSPLEGWEKPSSLARCTKFFLLLLIHHVISGCERAADGKSYVNPPAEKKSSAYTAFPAPITNGIRGGFDVHIYFLQSDPSQVQYATELWERIRREFPELRIYRLWDRPIGPHYTAMFE